MRDAARRRFAALLLVSGLLPGCHAPQPDSAPAVATPTVTLSRAAVPAGHLVDVTYRFAVAADAPPFAEDYVVIARVVAGDGEGMWTDEHQPSIPTRRWTPGDRIEYTRPLFVPRHAYPGRFGLTVGLRSPRTGEWLPLAGTPADGREYRVADVDLTSSGPYPVVAFFKGWHPVERVTGRRFRLGSEWYWSTRESELWCPNPRRDAQFVVRVDQPIPGSDATRSVQIRIAGTVVDDFQLPPGAEEVRRIPVAAAVLGTDDIVKIMLHVDKTIVPADVPGSGNADARALGVRVLDAFLEGSGRAPG
jgi:hypothetical protein